MMEWLIENKEWIFSGIGLAVLAGIFTLIKAFVAKTHSHTDLPEEKSTIQINTNTETQTDVSQDQTVRTDLTPKEILKAVNSVPPLQRKDIAKHYRGIRVKWSGSVNSIDEISFRSDTDVLIILCYGASNSRDIAFIVNPSEYKGLSLLDIGQKITVEGDIEDVGHSVKLANIKLSI